MKKGHTMNKKQNGLKIHLRSTPFKRGVFNGFIILILIALLGFHQRCLAETAPDEEDIIVVTANDQLDVLAAKHGFDLDNLGVAREKISHIIPYIHKRGSRETGADYLLVGTKDGPTHFMKIDFVENTTWSKLLAPVNKNPPETTAEKDVPDKIKDALYRKNSAHLASQPPPNQQSAPKPPPTATATATATDKSKGVQRETSVSIESATQMRIHARNAMEELAAKIKSAKERSSIADRNARRAEKEAEIAEEKAKELEEKLG